MKLKVLSSVVIILLTAILLPLVIVLTTDTEFDKYDLFVENDSLSKNLVFVSDTQDPIWLETLRLNENNNIEIKKSIFNKILDARPRAIFHMGDLVSLGFLNRDWKEVDDWINQLQRNGIRFYPVMGNHELMIFPQLGYANFLRRFPDFSKTGYLSLQDSLAVILLNSNFDNLSDDEIAYQNNWYTSKLSELDNNKNIKLVVVGCHYSPYTNSTIVDPSEEVQKYFVPPFIESKKARLFVSGHAHAFEHFKLQGKDFAVIGGGGGLQQPLKTGSEELWHDQFNTEDSIRRFHYTVLGKNENEYVFSVWMIDSTYSKFENIYTITL